MDSATAGIVAFSFAIGFSLTEVLFWNRRRGLGYVITMLVSIGLMLGLTTRYVVQPVCSVHASNSMFCIERPRPSIILKVVMGRNDRQALRAKAREKLERGALPVAVRVRVWGGRGVL